MIFHFILKILVIIGGLNWGVVGVTTLLPGSKFNAFEYLLVDVLKQEFITDSIYVLIGLAAVGMIIFEIVNRNA